MNINIYMCPIYEPMHYRYEFCGLLLWVIGSNIIYTSLSNKLISLFFKKSENKTWYLS